MRIPGLDLEQKEAEFTDHMMKMRIYMSSFARPKLMNYAIMRKTPNEPINDLIYPQIFVLQNEILNLSDSLLMKPIKNFLPNTFMETQFLSEKKRREALNYTSFWNAIRKQSVAIPKPIQRDPLNNTISSNKIKNEQKQTIGDIYRNSEQDR